MNRRYRNLSWISAVCLLPWLVLPAVATASNGPALSDAERELHGSLQDLDRELRRHLAQAQDSRLSALDGGDYQREVERLRRQLADLEGRAAASDAETLERLGDRFRALAALLRSLERVLDRGTPAVRPGDGGSRSPALAPRGGRSADRGAPANDACAAALPIGPGTLFGDSSTATNDGVASCGFSDFAPDVWYKFRFPFDGEIFVDTFGSTFDTVLSVHRGCPPFDAYDVDVECDDNTFGLQSAVSFHAEAGVDFWIRVSGFAGASGPFTLSVGPGGAISGTVTDAAGEPLPFVRLAAMEEGGYSSNGDTTAIDGRYTIGGLRAGTYFVYVEDSDLFVPRVFDGLPCPANRCDPESGTPIEVALNATVGGIDFALDLGGGIAGTVREQATGEPIPSAEVEIWDGAGRFVEDAFSNAQGGWEVAGLDAGTYFATVRSSAHQDERYDDMPCLSGSGSSCDPAAGTAIAVGLGATTAGVDFDLARFGSISGTITEEGSGAPIPSVDVEAHELDGYRIHRASTDAAGRYALGGLPAGGYAVLTDEFDLLNEVYDDVPCGRFCDPEAGAVITVEVEQEVTGIDFALQRRGAISGRITASPGGEPAGDVRVEVFDDQMSFFDDGFSDSAGFYRIARLVPGVYFLRTASEDYSSNRRRFLDELYDDLPCPQFCEPTAGTPVAVTADQTTEGIDFELVPRGSIAGRVSDEVTGVGLSSVRVEVRDAQGGFVEAVGTGSAGSYAVVGLEAGTYFVRTAGDDGYDDEDFNYRNELWDGIPCDPCDPLTGTPVAVANAAVTEGIDFALRPLATITGTVTNEATGASLRDVRVEVWTGAAVQAASDSTDGNGVFRIAGLADGTYFVRTRDDAYGDRFGFRNEVFDDRPCEGSVPDECDPRLGTPITVSSGEVFGGVDLALTPLGAISGTVRDEVTGAPLDGVNVVIVDPQGATVASDETSGSGFYGVGALEPGTYFVRTGGSAYYGDSFVHRDELFDDLPCEPGCDATAGTPVEVELGVTTADIDFDLIRLGAIAGVVRDAAGGNPIGGGVDVEVFDTTGERVASGTSDGTGRYLVEGLQPGNFFVTARSEIYLGQSWPGLPCPAGACDPTAGQAIPVAVAATTEGIDFALLRGGILSGRATDVATGRSISVNVELWDAAGALVASDFTSSDGRYVFTGLDGGSYFLSAEDFDFHAVLHGGRVCPGGVPAGCDPTSGTPVPVTAGSFTRVDFVLSERCRSRSDTMCLNEDRFRVEVAWEDFDAGDGSGTRVTLTEDSGYFWFFDDSNVELVVKVLDACFPPFDHFWVFAGGLTNVATELTVTDTFTGATRRYLNLLGSAFQPIRDTAAFATCEVGKRAASGPPAEAELSPAAVLGELEDEMSTLALSTPGLPGTAVTAGACGGGAALCLNDERFRVEASWRTLDGAMGEGQPVQLSGDTGYFWFFDEDNVEVMVKVLDACGLVGFRNFWVFAAGLTDVEVVLRVTDTETGESREYSNPLGSAFQPVQDTGSFQVCF